ncbi:hypothetical protein NQ315_007366 [Exocentrus adspersus]|uniref:Cytochrome P450 n=1 Tax=Exocentrus adspersus TaxID=1586481 RepID=A0AAV8VHE1_9CUCU|nr:hypothetical protein NQ315_007366 [Exocentrus adspersus]
MGTYLGSYVLDLLAVVTALIAVGYAYILWTFQYWKRKNVAHFEPVIPWGNAQSPLKRIKSPGEFMSKLCDEARSRGWKYFGMYSTIQINFVVMDLDLVKNIMTKDFHIFTDRGLYTNEKDDPLSAHLFAIGGAKWRLLRTKLSPTFTSGKMKSMFSTLADCGLVLEKYIDNSIDNVQGIDIKEILAKFSTDVIGSCAFGLEFNSFTDENSPFRYHGRKLFQRNRLQLIRVTFTNAFPNLARAMHITSTPKDTSDFFRKAVADTITYRQKNNVTRNDFLQLLIELMDKKVGISNGFKGSSEGTGLTMDEAAAQCFVFFIAGYETSSTTMAFALFQMAVHQDVQEKVRNEIKTVLAKHDNQITYDSLNELKYMRQVMDVPFVTRIAGEDYKLPGKDVVIEKGTRVVIPIQAIHMDQEVYPNPTEFDPERFSEENKAKRHQYAHIPFGEGPRICIGERFGIMQTKFGLTSILRNFRVTLNKRTKLPLELSPKSFFPTAADGIWLNIEKL